MQDVLCLNRNFFAIHIIDWQKALTLLVSEKADVIDSDYRRYSFLDWKELSAMMKDNPSGFVHSPSCRIAVPDAIILKLYDRLPTTDVKFTRRNIYKHYENRCCYCGEVFDTKDLNLDHVVPRSKGGKTDWSNIVLSCIPCNSKKADKLLHETNLKVHYKPTEPSWRSVLNERLAAHVGRRSSWAKFTDSLYWNVELENR